jgi:hypothetical protein
MMLGFGKSDEEPQAISTVDPVFLREVARAHRCFDALLTRRSPHCPNYRRLRGSTSATSDESSPLRFFVDGATRALSAGRRLPFILPSDQLESFFAPTRVHLRSSTTFRKGRTPRAHREAAYAKT